MNKIIIAIITVICLSTHALASDIISITSPQISYEYDANEFSSDKKYKGKILRVKGVVNEISRDLLGDIYVSLIGMDEMQNVQCFFEEDDAEGLENINKGSVIEIQGKCDGYMLINVIIKNSKLISK